MIEKINNADFEIDTQSEREGRTKGNAEYQKVAVHLLTFSTTTLAIPIVFFKYIVGEKIPKNTNLINIINNQGNLFILFGNYPLDASSQFSP